MAFPSVLTAVYVRFGVIYVTMTLAWADEVHLNGSDLNSLSFFHITPDYRVMVRSGFDMLVTLDEYKTLHTPDNSSRSERAAAIASTFEGHKTRWLNGIIYYQILPLVEYFRQNIMNAIREWEYYTCLRFVQSTNKFRLLFSQNYNSHKSCSIEYFGAPHGKHMSMYVDWTCMGHGKLVHLIGHAIGLIDENNRPDRDRYLRFNWDRRSQPFSNIFRKYSENTVDTFGVEFDYRSIMHMVLIPVMVTKDPKFQNILGKIQHVSFKDIKTVNLMYSCAEIERCLHKHCPFNGFVFFKEFDNKAKCECWCDSGNNANPLVLCSSLTSERERYNLIEISSMAERDYDTCLDDRPDCAILKEENMCSAEIRQMMVVCTKSCDFCGKGYNLCMDHDVGCEMMAESGVCKEKGLAGMISNMCPKSCGLCIRPASECDIQNELQDVEKKSRGVLMIAETYISFGVLIITLVITL